jgi:hypothetical protein
MCQGIERFTGMYVANWCDFRRDFLVVRQDAHGIIKCEIESSRDRGWGSHRALLSVLCIKTWIFSDVNPA